jgi:hypothetical protein
MSSKENKPKFGTIVISNKEIDVEVTQWWGKGDKQYEALEVRIPCEEQEQEKIYFRDSKGKGWRRYNKLTVPKYNKINENIIFIPNKIANN